MAVLERRVTRAAGWARRTGAFALVLSVTAALSHCYSLLDTPAFLTVLTLVPVIACAALVFAGVAFHRFWNDGDLGGFDLGVGTLLALIVLAPFLFAGYRAAVLPMLADISTDTADPPSLVQAAAARGSGMNRVLPIAPPAAAEQARAYPNVTGRRYDLPFDQALEVVEAVMAAKGWSFRPGGLEHPPGEVTIEAETATPLIALPVDVSVRLTDEAGPTYVDMRSAWRYGRHDLGDNAARISAFLAELDAEVIRRTTAVAVE
jgi:hypothetical protein